MFSIIYPDVNECTMMSVMCTGGCVNYAGGHRCTCPSGQTLAGDGYTCQGCK